MGQKIATEEDFWMCSGGLMPIQLQSVQQIALQKNDKKYLTQGDTYTSPNGDFICRKLMLLAAIIAAIIVVAIVATGGAALGAIVAAGAIAGAAGAAAGAAVGALICGQKVALVRLWGMAKGDFMISNQKAITTGSQMECPIFGDKIIAAPNVKNWWQALAIGFGNFGEEVIMGAMFGALIGLGGAALAGEAAIAFPTLTSIGSNVWASISGWGMAVRVYFGANNTANKYATGEIDINNQDQRDASFLEAAFPEYGSIKRICSGTAQPSDALILLYFLHVKAPAGKPAEPPAGEGQPPEPPVNEGKPPEPPQEGSVPGEKEPPAPVEEGKKPGEDGKSYEKGKGKEKTKGTPEDQLSNKGKDTPPLTPEELARIEDWQNFRNKFLKKWRNKDFSSFDDGLQSKLKKAKNSITKHLTPDDLAGTIKEARGEKILDENGVPYDHIQENANAKNSVKNAIKELKEKMKTEPDPSKVKEYESMLKDLSTLLDKVNSTQTGK